MKMLKANGENAQISYIKEIECWAISSKNVCLLARSDNDNEIETYYSSDRFHFAKLMAHAWLTILGSLSQKDID